jgi:hypothetical protein
MTTFVRSRRNDNVLIGFFALVLAGMAVRVGVEGRLVGTVVFGLLALAMVGLGVWLNQRPSREIRISPTEIIYVVKGHVTARIGHTEAAGRVMVHTQIQRGHAWFSLVDAEMTTGTSLPLDGFRIPAGGLQAACAEHGWHLVS